MTSDHLVFIPLILFVGMFFGFILGARAARNAVDLERKRDEERAITKAAREQRKAEKAKPSGGNGG